MQSKAFWGLLILVLFLGILGSVFVTATEIASPTSSLPEPEEPGADVPVPEELEPLPSSPAEEPAEPPEVAAGPLLVNPAVEVKGIYATGAAAGSPKIESLIKLIETTELNALVIDLKDDTGRVSYQSGLEVVEQTGAGTAKIKEITGLVRTLRIKDIYPIARIVVFKDPVFAAARPDLAVQRKSGGVWKDYKGLAWMDPYSREVWDYNLALAEEAAQMGFREVQFDYVRFPSDGPMQEAVYTHADENSPEDTIAEFLKEAHKRLSKYGVYVSADVFGLTTTVQEDMRIGQKWEKITANVDYISPMVYPSHYISGNYGLKDPNREPYATVRRSLADAVYRNPGNGATIRPWLQDFSLGYPYGPEEVRAQIQAAYDAGVTQWLLWNARNVYTEEALED